MFVIDASALIELLIASERGARLRDRLLGPGSSLHAPYLIDVETTQVLRRLARLGGGAEHRASVAVEGLLALRIRRYGHLTLLPRIWALRDNVSAYDAAYVTLAELLRVPLLTYDARLARSSGHTAQIELLS